MMARALLAALLCGCLAGLVMGVIQHVRLTPLIMQAETYENAPAAAGAQPAAPAQHNHVHGQATAEGGEAAAAPAAAAPAEHVHDENAWQPADGMERTLYTVLSTMLTGAGFAALLAGVAFLTGTPITAANGWVWGLCGFLAVSLAPAAGLPPELPGMPAADLTARQVWWLFTAVATATGLWLIGTRRQPLALAAAAVLILLPHALGAPTISLHESVVPAGLAAAHAANSLAANALFWLLIGLLLGRFLPHPEEDHA